MSLQRTYQNFHLAILEDSEPGTYRMVVSDSPMGEQPPVAAVIDHEDLTQDLSQLKPHHPQKGLISFGQRLSEVLFPGPLRDLFRRSLESIPPEDGMRLCLQMDNPHLASFPWELCCLPEAPGKATFSDFLALNPRISIHRVFPTAHPGTNPPLSPYLVIAIAEHTYGSTTDQSPLWSLYKKPIEINGRQLEVAWEDHLTQESLSVILAKEPGLFQLVGRFDTQGDTGGGKPVPTTRGGNPSAPRGCQ